MVNVIEVVYENGVFKPMKKVTLPEKAKGKVIIEERVMGDIEEIIEEIDKALEEADISEDPLEVLLEMRKRTWD